MVALRHLMVSVLAILCLNDVAEAKITIRHGSPFDKFYFHAQSFNQPILPGDGFGLEVWNCASGALPVFVADLEPLIVCNPEAPTGYTLATLVYEVDVPAGTCVDRGLSCVYRDSGESSVDGGIGYFRVQYARRNHGNRIWLESYGDLLLADQARMLLVVKVNGNARAVLGTTFKPLRNGGWSAKY